MVSGLMENMTEIAKEHGYVMVTQNIEDIKKAYPVWYRGINHKYKTNNWLKMHGEPMRRKPFEREYMFMDETYRFFEESM